MIPLDDALELAEVQPSTEGDSVAPTRSIRICHVAYTFYESDNRVLRYAQEMARAGHQVDVIALRASGQAPSGDVDGVRVFRVQSRSVTERSPLSYLAKVVAFFVTAGAIVTGRHLRHRYDLVHVHNMPDFLVFTALVPRLSGARVILDIHDLLPELYLDKFRVRESSLLHRALLAVERLSCRFADHVIVANVLWRETLRARAAPSCTAMLNYPDIEVFSPRRDVPPDNDTPFVFLYPGSLNYHQGVDLAVRAFHHAQTAMPGAELHVYGEGPALPALTALVQELALEQRVFLRSKVPLSKVAVLMARANVGVVPKRADGFGNEAFSTKVLEFMACKVPVVVARTKVDAYHFEPALVRFFEPGDAEALAEAMLDVFQNRTEALRRAEAAHRFVTANSWQQRASEYRTLVAVLTAGRTPVHT